jgi:hypothetical protein
MTKTLKFNFGMYFFFLMACLIVTDNGRADTIYLKNGQSIQVDKAWKENGLIKYNQSGVAVGIPENQVLRIQKDAVVEQTSDGKKSATAKIMERVKAVTEKIAEKFARKKETAADGKKKNKEPAIVSLQDLIDRIGKISPYILLSILVFPPFAAWILGKFHESWEGNQSPWKYFYSILVYMVCIPGIFSFVLVAYSVFFTRQNLLAVNAFVYFFPIVTMIVTLVVIGKKASWKRLPGVDRLYGLMIVLAITFRGPRLPYKKTRIFYCLRRFRQTIDSYRYRLFYSYEMGHVQDFSFKEIPYILTRVF